MHLISVSLIIPTCFGALPHNHTGDAVMHRNKTRGGLSLNFVYPNFTPCIYVFADLLYFCNTFSMFVYCVLYLIVIK
jgi:hypothetical protein